VLCFLLIFITIVDGFQVANSPAFIFLELVLNMMVGVDFACRLKLIGVQKYFKHNGHYRWWNIFDAFVV
jgi:hypothetical protein